MFLCNCEYIDKHYTNIYDEYRTKESISIDYIRGISIPYNNLINDPISFMMFASEDILIDYYTCGIEPIVIRQILDLKSDNISKMERKRLLDNYLIMLNYLLKQAKANGITMDIQNQLKYKNLEEEIG